MRIALFFLVLLVGGCVIQAPPREVIQPAPVAEEVAPPPAVVSVYEEPPLSEPAPIAVGWAPPPMLVEAPPPPPFPYAVWVGGYWVWQGNWVWAHGQWMAPPRAQYVWVHPYYEHRGGAVIFISGYWSAPGVGFVQPSSELVLAVEPPAVGVIPGPRPIGPEGCFVPAPPGSRRGIIVPAPVGTAPAVVTSAPPVVAVGMRVTTNVSNVHNTNIHNTNITNVTNVTIVAPPTATANGRAFSSSVPAAPHLAAGRPALVQARAPQPVSTRAVMPYVSAHAHPVAPPSQPHGAVADVHLQPVVAREPRPVHAGSAGSAQTEHTAHREERASPPARSVQSAPAKAAAAGTPMARTPDAKAATARAPAAATARAPAAATAASKTAAAKTAPAHPDNGKAHKPDAKKDAQQAHP